MPCKVPRLQRHPAAPLPTCCAGACSTAAAPLGVALAASCRAAASCGALRSGAAARRRQAAAAAGRGRRAAGSAAATGPWALATACMIGRRCGTADGADGSESASQGARNGGLQSHKRDFFKVQPSAKPWAVRQVGIAAIAGGRLWLAASEAAEGKCTASLACKLVPVALLRLICSTASTQGPAAAAPWLRPSSSPAALQPSSRSPCVQRPYRPVRRPAGWPAAGPSSPRHRRRQRFPPGPPARRRGRTVPPSPVCMWLLVQQPWRQPRCAVRWGGAGNHAVRVRRAPLPATAACLWCPSTCLPSCHCLPAPCTGQ